MVFRTLAALSFTVVVSAEYFEGDGTSYTLGDISSGNCNFMSAIPTASTNYAALNNDQWDNLANCGRCAEVSCIDDQCTDQTTTAIVQILDRCPECSSGDLDLSPTVFKTITGSDPSRLSIRWKFVDCPNPGNIEVCLKSGSNGYYVAVQPTNTLVGVETVTINGEATTMVDSAYYYLIESTSDVDLTSVAVSITSVEGETVEGTYSLTAGECVDTDQQFTTSSSSQTTSSTTYTSTTTTAPTSNTTTPASTTATPTSTTATPVSTTATPVSTTATPVSTTAAPASTTAIPTSTTATPISTTATQTWGSVGEDTENSLEEDVEATTSPTSTTSTPASTTSTPVATTTIPPTTTTAPTATTTTPTTNSPKCRVRSRRG
ncbi:hypothetical protein F441_10803 [Phytophthora nicotianae CJ01A1]|uniref:Expansin-like EG45 domain-containing protein n=4 Tax=Phytophthora nicotianae TaxID=4792 RepID=V9EYT8_PHYNI|nr:hypothetical protein F443_10877 [Phytophthora nicotianae P1569]ETK84418.1 hypothetical protein L915_10613 [Phytophthora nicotianae]ETO73081.1 hypothetical protein F444_10937 [Phytophthora nicotianae P1976]ETP14212.1 hypothetical protein F441_10803 [Phytophthora nicotianae CJ01A1]ETL37858.1 hypothetical protein L916_10503 [Phytophthora nicotianae]